MSCTWVGANPSINRGWRMTGLRAALLRRTWGYWWMKTWAWATNVCSQLRRPTISWAASKKRGQQVNRGDSAPLLHSGETPPGVLHPALEPSAQERHGLVGAGPEEGHKNGQRDGAHLLWEKIERAGAIQPGEEKALGRPYGSLPVLKGGLLEILGQTLQ